MPIWTPGRSLPTARRWRRSTALAAAMMIGCACCASSAMADPVGTLSLFAGTGVYGVPTLGLATSSQVGYAHGLALDPITGDLYIADSGNNEIEQVTPAGTLSVVAGNGSSGTPTPGLATDSALNAPYGVAVDPSTGDVYIADSGNCDIEQVTTSGILSVIVGNNGCGTPTTGTATNSELDGPNGVAVDPNTGDVYIADAYNAVVEQVTPSGTLSIVAGTGTPGGPTPGLATDSEIGSAYGVAIDPATGDLYIADNGDNLIEKVTAAGTLSVIAGGGGSSSPGPATDFGMNGPTQVAVDPITGDVYVVDQINNRIEQVTPSGTLSFVAGTGSYGTPGTPTPIPGPATSESLGNPYGVAVDPNTGDVYIADTYNFQVEQVLGTPPPAPVDSTLPTVSGIAQQGQALTATQGVWTNSPLSYAYQWQDCDAAGDDCADIPGATASNYTLTGGDSGHTVRVGVTAQNNGGSASAESLMTAVIVGSSGQSTTTSTTSTLSTTSSSTTPTTTATQADAVSVPTDAASAGLTTSAGGRVSVPLQCPTVVTGVCEADGTLSIALSAPTAATEHADAIGRASSGESVIAKFAGVQIAAGHERLVATKLSASTIAYLRAHDIYRVRVTLRINTTLTSGQTVPSAQHLWLYVSGLTGCHAATGTLSAAGIGSLKLGMTRASAHRTGHYKRTTNGFEHYCVAGGQIRVAYPARALVRAHRADARRALIALTGNRHYVVQGITARMTVKRARARLKLAAPIVIGKNAWYFLPGRKATRILKAQHGVIREIGITRRSLTGTRAQDRYLLHHL